MQSQVELEGFSKKWWDYRPLYNTRPARRRLICVVGMAWFGQYSGQAIVGYFLPLMAKTAGNCQCSYRLADQRPPSCGYICCLSLWGIDDRSVGAPCIATLLDFPCLSVLCHIDGTGSSGRGQSQSESRLCDVGLSFSLRDYFQLWMDASSGNVRFL